MSERATNVRLRPCDTELSRRVKALRMQGDGKKPYSMAGVARKLDITYQSYQAIEAGKTAFTVSLLLRIASIYGTTPEALLRGISDGA